MSVRRTVVALVGAALLASGCSDDPESRFQPTDPPSPTESTTTAQPEAQSPEEFIREWVELQRDMQNTGNVDEYLVASAGCESCLSTARLVEGYYAAGGFVRTQGRSILAIRPIKRGETYDVKVRSAPTEYRESADGPLQSFAGGVTTYRVTLRRQNNSWILTDEVEVSDS